MGFAPLIIGKVLGHYRILDQIDAGGLGVVYRAHDERLDSDVAIKVLPPGTLADEGARKRFRKEALALAKLNHPNIATIHDFDTQDGSDFLVMEHVSGVTLAEKTARGSLFEKEVLAIGTQIARTLEDAHEQGIVHRDLKPSNIMVTARGQVKLLDFGLAKLLRVSEVAATESLTEIGDAGGTLPYMAPEQLRGELPDFRSDIYSLGVVLYELATGQRPFTGTVSSAVIDDILRKPPPPPGRFQPRLSPRLEEIILKCLEKEPDNRYQSAKELMVDLRRLRSPNTGAAPTGEIRLRWRRVLPMMAAALICMAALLFFLNVGGWRERRLLGRAHPMRIDSLTLASQSRADSSFCSMKADRSKAVKSKATVVTKIEGDIGHATDYLGAERWMKTKIPYETWDQIAARFAKDIINNTAFPPRNHGQPSLLKEAGYRNEIAALLSKPFGFQWAAGNEVDILLNGPASFAKRKELIEKAQESIYMFAWAFYDDGTGWDFADWLINAKLKRLCAGGDLEIKIVVDGNVTQGMGYHDVLNYLEKYPGFTKSPIEIIRVNDKRDPYFGMHRKVMIVDREHAVMGGMNVGNKYSHLYPDPGGHWRDTDVYVRGPAVNQAQMTFVDEWNKQKGRQEMTYRPFTYRTLPGNSFSMIVDHQPLRDDNIHIATVKAFYGATQTIDIENAYFIADTVIEKAIMDALKRGVRVRILSNSKESIDEPTITTPILKSLARVKSHGAEVYTKKVYGDSTTMHSKLLIVDGVFSWIGSHNFHPRSYRYEREVVLVSFDETLAGQFREIFEKDIASDKANQPTVDELNGFKSTQLSKFISTHFFDQL